MADAVAPGANTQAGLTVEDRFAIQDLIARFAHCSDYRDYEGLAKLYVLDVVTEMDGIPMSYKGIEEQIKHAKISDEQTGGKNRHYNFNLYIEEVDGKVFANYFFVNANAGGKPLTAQIVTSGRMRDTVVRTSDGWRIAHRKVSFDQSFDLDW